MKKVYFDFQILNELMNNNFLENPNFSHVPFISVAHGEELFKMIKNNKPRSNNDEIQKKKEILKLMSKNGIIGPISYIKSVGICYQDFNLMMKVVSKYDTTTLVKLHGQYYLEKNKENTQILKQINRDVINYSNLSEAEIMEQIEIIEQLNHLKDYLCATFELYKDNVIYSGIEVSTYQDQLKQLLNLDTFKNKYENFKDKYWAFESIVERLYRILDECGYNRDKNIRTSESANYDTQHAINATYCDIFVTNDKHFLKKTKAVYYYLGIKTEVMTLKEYKEKYNLLYK